MYIFKNTVHMKRNQNGFIVIYFLFCAKTNNGIQNNSSKMRFIIKYFSLQRWENLLVRCTITC